MQIDVYHSTKKGDCFLSVPAGTDLSTIQITHEEATVYGELRTFQKSLSIDASDRKVAIDSNNVIDQISDKGYAIHRAVVQFRGV
jgi:uncharacterized protein YcgL (UPF0745 family)